MATISGNIRYWPAKAPSATLDFTADLSAWMAQAANDSLLSVDIVSITPSDLTSLTPNITLSPLVVLWLSGGTHNTEYSVVLRPTTVAGRTDVFVFMIPVIDPQIVVADQIGSGLAGA